MGGDQKQRIVVLGGGVGALSAAFYLTEQPGWQDKYEITVYQQGWRLGGKCASGHDMRPGYGNRIYEHGLHIFAGFYDQAFNLLRLAYEAIARPPDHPNSTVWEAFTSEDTITLMYLDYEGKATVPWLLDLPPNDLVPGDTTDIPQLSILLQQLVGFLIHFNVPQKTQTPPTSTAPPRSLWDKIKKIFEAAVPYIKEYFQDFMIYMAWRTVVHSIERYMRSRYGGKLGPGGQFRQDVALMSIFLLQTIIHGVREDKVMEKGYDALDTYEWSEWLFKHGVEIAKRYPEWGDPTERARDLIEWTPMSSLYDYAFAYSYEGDKLVPAFGAGTALRAALLMISYKGHFFYAMRGAMGDVVIAPVYLALAKRGVKFKFFHRITALNIDEGSDSVGSIDYVEQVRLKDPEGEYRPLIDVPIPGWELPLEGWPAEPLWDQLQDGESLKRSGRDFEADHAGQPGEGDIPRQLRAGADFDKVILGISVGGLKQVCGSFPARLPKSNWGPMFEALTVTPTCSMQIWTRRSVADLGSDSFRRTLTGSAQPYSTWSDMGHLLEREDWRGDHRPLSVVYFCGQLPPSDDSRPANDVAFDAAVDWLKQNTQLYWHMAASPDCPYGLDPALIFDPEPEAGGDVLRRQYIRANINPSDLYVQSPPSSIKTRMDANESGLGNLFLAGDWTLNGINSGCAESAARSGWRCAQAIAGDLPPLA